MKSHWWSSAPLACLSGLLLAVAAGCRTPPPTPVSGLYKAPNLPLEVALPSGAWTLQPGKESTILVFRAEGLPGQIIVQVTKLSGPAPRPAVVLAEELLLDFQEKRILETRRRVVAECEAVCQDWVARVEKTRIRARSCVFEYQRTVYDLVVWAPEDRFDAIAEQYEAFLRGIRLPPPSGEG